MSKEQLLSCKVFEENLNKKCSKRTKVENPIHASSYKHVFIHAFYTSFVLNSAPVFMN